MARENRTGVILPIKTTVKHRLKDGTERIYTRYRAKINGKWVSARTYKQCDNAIKKTLKELNSWGAVFDSTTTFGDYSHKWLEGKKASTDPNSFANYTTIVMKHLKPYARQKVANLSPTLCRRIIDGLKVTSRSEKDEDGTPKMVKASLSLRRQAHTTLNQICKSAVADRVIPTNPMESVPVPRNKDITHEQVRERQSFTVEQMQTMLSKAACMGPEKGAIWWWRLLTGMRQGEILGASIEDLELSNTGDIPTGIYRVNWKLEHVPRDHGCGNPIKGVYPCGKKRGAYCPQAMWRIPEGYDMTPLIGMWCLTRPKSKTGRIVPIIPMLAQVMSAYLEATKNGPNPYGLIFHTAEGNPIDPADDESGFRDLMKLAGIDHPEQRFGHETRHAAVSLLSSMGVDPEIVKQIVGHSSIEMVEHYRHINIAEMQSAMETLDSSLNLSQIEWKK
ncbi:tyrosine-type recombinase/integrase [Bifidobacterium aquikefiri]|uniref:tyrosine-type recombinase/integrase n=1 Tax=Bifidobacterium aquikefiri TaxID=1653207 RepID=UPI0039EC9340